MKTNHHIPWLRPLPACAALALFTAACSDQSDRKARIKELEAEVASLQSDSQNLGTHIRELEQKNAELREQAARAEQQASQARREAESARHELQAVQTAKAAEQEKARREEPTRKLGEVKETLTAKLAALVTIEGDAVQGRGCIVKADGRTWLYAPAGTLSGNTKLAVKDSAGATLAKFGEFQVAADIPLCRLEILQEVPTAFDAAVGGALADGAALVTAAPMAEGGPLKVIESRVTETSASGFAMDAYLTAEANGSPVLAADSGELVAILATPTAIVPLWQDAQPAGYQNPVSPRAQRINRAVDWKKVSLAGFLAERRKVDEINRTTRLLAALAAVRAGAAGLEMETPIPGATLTVSQVFDQNAALPVVAEVRKLHADLTSTKGVKVAERDISRRLERVFQEADSLGKRQLQDFKAATVSPYHQAAVADALKARAEADKAITGAIQALGK